jgi:tRNA dimethylallyltransferase
MPTEPIKLLVIVGPTAVGKTSLSIALGQAFEGEVISADSRQIYRYMDIGTAKATPAERALLPHHLIDIVDPDDKLTLAQYLRLARTAVVGIASRGRLPMLVGGTGLYVRALLEGWTVPEVPPDTSLRQRLRDDAERLGYLVLHERLHRVDPDAAARIDPRNVRRVIRALEVFYVAGRRISDLQGRHPPNYDVLRLGLTRPRAALYQRIDERVETMLDQGLVEEVRRLVACGYGYDLPSMSALGYRQIGQHLRGEITLDQAVALIKRHTRRFVRQQYNWFRLNDPQISWVPMDALDVDRIKRDISDFVGQDD